MIRVALAFAVATALCGQSVAMGIVPRDAGFWYHFGVGKDESHGTGRGRSSTHK